MAALLLAASLSFALPASAAAQPSDPSATSLVDIPPASLDVWNRTLAVFRVPVNDATPVQRAAAARARIEAVLDRLQPDQIRSAEVQIGSARGVLILGGTETLFGLHELDLPQGTATTLEAASLQAVNRLQAIVRDRSEQRRWPTLLRSIALSILGTLGFFALWVLVARAQHRTARWLGVTAARRIGRTTIGGVDPRPFVFKVLAWLTRVAAMVTIAAAGYLWLTFVLNHFAYSRPWGARLGEFLVGKITGIAAAFVQELPNLLTLLIIVFVTRAIAGAAGAWFRAVEDESLSVSWLDQHSARAARKLVVIGIWLFAITVAYPYVPGAETDAFKGVSVFVGLMVSLGSAGVIGQVMSGFFVIFNRALRPGEFVQIGETQGVVKELGLMAVRVIAHGQKEITIPNSVVIGSATTNLSRSQPGTVVLMTTATIGYDAPWRQVQALLLLAAARTDGVANEPRPEVVQSALSDFYVQYDLVAYGTSAVPRPVLMSRLHAHILDVFNEHGVQIMSPHFEGQPDKPVVVPRSRWFTEPARPPDRGSS
jgi:small-conductance mechanosensitive channel